jgi:hypothetical protein
MNFLAAVLIIGLGDAPAIELRGKIDGKNLVSFVVTGLDSSKLAVLAKSKLQKSDWNSLFSISVVSDRKDANNPPLLGSHSLKEGMLRFEPRFAPVRGVCYRAVFNPAKLPGGKAEKFITADFLEPKPEAKSVVVVEHVYPTRDRLPENQLKFYLYFSAPMSKGGSYRHIRLLNSEGKQVEAPFLELDEELWDAEQRRFTLYFDPGRVKRGLKPREEVGPVLEEGKSYTLVIDKSWTDAEGAPLRESFRKSFRVGPPDDEPIEPKKWQVSAPQADSRKPVIVSFTKPLDHALLQRLVWIADKDGKKISGAVAVTDDETCWRFTPDSAWVAGEYQLSIDKALEDLAGNNVGRPFEVDVFRTVQSSLKGETVHVPFRIARP